MTTVGERTLNTSVTLTTHLPAAWPALLGYAITHTAILASVWIWARDRHTSLLDRLSNYDGIWYAKIAAHGYDHAQHALSNMAFFPLYPWLMRITGSLVPVGYRNAGIIVAAAASLAAAWGLYAIGDHLYGPRVGILAALVWGLQPWAVVESMAYTECLFTALAAWALWALLRGRWLTAAALTMAAGLTRPTAWALIAVICVAAIVAVLQRRDGWRPWATMVIAPAGWVGYLAWVAARTGRIDGWLQIQARWGTSFDGGRDTIRTTVAVMGRSTSVRFLAVTLVLLAALSLFALSILDHQPWPLLAYIALTLATTLGAAGYYHSKARFLLPAFALLLPVARALARIGWARVAAVLAPAVIVAAWWGGYLLMISPVSP